MTDSVLYTSLSRRRQWPMRPVRRRLRLACRSTCLRVFFRSRRCRAKPVRRRRQFQPTFSVTPYFALLRRVRALAATSGHLQVSPIPCVRHPSRSFTWSLSHVVSECVRVRSWLLYAPGRVPLVFSTRRKSTLVSRGFVRACPKPCWPATFGETAEKAVVNRQCVKQ